MGVFEYEQEPQSTGSSTHASTTNTDDVRDIKPVSVVDSGSNGYSQHRVTIPSKFIDELDITADDHLLIGIRDDELVIRLP